MGCVRQRISGGRFLQGGIIGNPGFSWALPMNEKELIGLTTKTEKTGFWQPGVAAALLSAFLFGAGTPLAKSLLDQVSPWMLAGLLYLGSGLGLALYRRLRGATTPRLEAGELRWLVAAVLCGGGIAPVLLMLGLAAMPASHAALLLNAESVLTVLLAWAVFKENVDKRIALGMAAIVAGALLLSWPSGDAAPGGPAATTIWPALAVTLACFFWALDRTLTT
jgi:drug/metabolite transporter (DMT)-like permease